MSITETIEFDTVEMINKYKNGDNSVLEDIVKNNQGLVYKVARHYCNSASNMFDFEDIVQEGNIGLLNAVKTYNSSKAAFSTYAIPSINWSIIKYIKKIKKIKEESIEIPIYKNQDNEGVSILDTLEDDSAIREFEKIDEIAEKKVIIKEVRSIVKGNLNLQEKQVVEMHYGFCGKCFSYSEIGDVLGKSTQRISYIDMKSLEKLRKSPYCEKIFVERQKEAAMKMNSNFFGNVENIAIRKVSKEKNKFYIWYFDIIAEIENLKLRIRQSDLNLIYKIDYLEKYSTKKRLDELENITMLINSAMDYLILQGNQLGRHIVSNKINGVSLSEIYKSCDKKDIGAAEKAAISFINNYLKENEIEVCKDNVL